MRRRRLAVESAELGKTERSVMRKTVLALRPLDRRGPTCAQGSVNHARRASCRSAFDVGVHAPLRRNFMSLTRHAHARPEPCPCLDRARSHGPDVFGVRVSIMIDLHSHILPGLDDGAPSLEVALAMAQAFVDDGVQIVAATPHIMPGVWGNTGPAIRSQVALLQDAIDREGLPLTGGYGRRRASGAGPRRRPRRRRAVDHSPTPATC